MAATLESMEGDPRPLRHTMSQDSMYLSSQADTPDTAALSDCSNGLDTQTSATPASRIVSSRGKAQRPVSSARWRLVWCHERVHKQECAAQRRAMGEAAKSAKASMLAPKKAAKFVTWLTQAKRPPYVLLTDWREVKPCLEAVAVLPRRPWPALTVVIAEQPRLYERACHWAANQPPDVGPIHVFRDTSPFDAFLGCLASADEFWTGMPCQQRIEQELRAALQGVASRLRDPKRREVIAEATVAPMEDRVLLPPPTEVDTLWEQEPAGGDSVLPPLPVDAGTTLEQLRAGEPDVGMKNTCSKQTHAVDVALPILWSLFTCHSPLELEQILRQAMPDHYDD